MKNCAQKLAFVFLVPCLLFASNPPQQNDVTAKVTTELRRVQTLAAEQKSDGEWKDLAPLVNKVLTRADEALKTGRLFAAIEDLTRGRLYLEAYITSQVTGEAATLPAFEAVWKKADLDLSAQDKSARQRSWAGRPVVQQALAESAQGQSLTLVEASRAYATVTEPKAGYYYVGEARANTEVATYIYGLELQPSGKRFPLRSWLAELQSLQKKVNAEFVPPKSIERHTDFIRVNSTIKLAGELDASKLYAGALYQYLTAVQLFGAMNAEALSDAAQAELKKNLADWNQRIRSSKRDDSLAQMFVERAELWVNHADGSEVNPEQWKAAWSVVNAVLPAYERALSAVPQVEIESKKAVTVTLVRWPYT